LAAAPASAHGPPPAILKVVAADAAGPRVLTLTEGLATLLGGRWVFVCPSLFGSPQMPRALSNDGRTTWVASEGGTFLMDEGRVRAIPLPAGDARVTALANAGGSTFGLRFSAGGVDVVRLDPSAPEVVFSDPVPWTLFAGEGTSLFLGRLEPAKLVVLELSTTGAAIETGIVDTNGWEGAIVDLRASGGSLYAEVFFGASYALFRIEGGRVVELRASDSPIVGPATTGGGTTWIGSAMQLEPLNGGTDASAPQPAVAPLSCLETLGSASFACQQHRLNALDDGGLAAPLMALDALVPPTESDGDLGGSEACKSEWIVFRNDLANIGIGGEREEVEAGTAGSGSTTSTVEPDASGACGCRYAHATTTHGLLAALTIYLLVTSSRARKSPLRRLMH